MHRRKYYLMWMVFLSGVSVMGIEMSASRLLRPFFGDSILVWANVIGLILVYLSLGYILGGRWADRDARSVTFYRIIAWAGFTTGIIPFIARPLLNLAIPALEKFDAGLGFASFAGTLVLFIAPVTLLGCVSPFAIRLSAREIESTGTTAGNLYALSTFGSILGVFGTVFVLLALIGTQATMITYSLALLASAVAGMAWERESIRALRYALLILVVLLLVIFIPGGTVKATSGLVYETESFYNYIQVVDDGGWRLLTVNEGQAYQSAYRADRVLTGGIWDLFLIAPWFTSNEPPRNALLIGLAAGTVARGYTQVYGAIPIDGVELDPAIISIGQKYFAMNEPNLNIFPTDGRDFLERRAGIYDVIALDAYRQPYIPFHLTTVEFFRATREHLTPRGVVALNAARTRDDYRLVDALAATMRRVFANVYLIDHPNNANTLIVATNQPTQLEQIKASLARVEDPTLRVVAEQSLATLRVASQTELIFTDDHAPVENLINEIILVFALRPN
jgi:spermidine synthase